MRKFFLTLMRVLTVGALMAGVGSVAAQQPYPNKPIRFITPYTPGGGASITARLIAQKLTESWGQQVLIDNRPGGGTMVGTDALAKSSPDGYTILLTGSTHTLLPQLIKAPYDPIKDFAPVATIGSYMFVLLINPSIPVNNLKEFIAYAKARPGQLNYATPGAGGTQHLAHELLNLSADIKTLHIPYKGGNQAVTDLLGGQVQLYFSTAVSAIPFVNSGRLKALAIGGDKRLSTMPEVPTFDEAGLPALSQAGGFFGILAPAGTPKPIVDKISAEVAKYLAMPDFQEKLVSNGLDAFINTPEKFAAILKVEMARYAKIIKAANITFEN